MWRDDATLCGVPGREMTGKMVELGELCGVWEEKMAPFGAYRWKLRITSCAGSVCGCSVWVVVVVPWSCAGSVCGCFVWVVVVVPWSWFSPVILASTETG